MKFTFHYLNTLALALSVMVGISSCSSLDEDGLYTELNSPPMGSSTGPYKELSILMPDKQVLEKPFEITNVFYGDYEKDGLLIKCYTLSDELPVPKSTEFSILLKVPYLDGLKAGQLVNIYRSQFSWPLSSNAGDYQSYIPNGASVIVREANAEYIDLYIDHLKFVFSSGFHLGNGDYTVFGDIKFWRSDINYVQE